MLLYIDTNQVLVTLDVLLVLALSLSGLTT